MLSPWNAGSGFYFREGKSTDKDPATGKLIKTGARNAPTEATRTLAALLASTSTRLVDYRACATVAKAIVQELGLDSAPTEADKPALIAALRSRLPSAGMAWLDASVSSLGEEFACAPLLGSGGNDGNEDFSNNYLQRVLRLLTDAEVEPLIAGALFGAAVAGARDIAAGQFLPGGNGGYNAGVGFESKSAANVWDYVLAIEGTLTFGGGTAHRLDQTAVGAAFPFSMRLDPAGYASVADKDRDDSRLEMWLPLWSMPANASEVRALLVEGRARLDRRGAANTVEFARSVAKLGTSRGIVGFERTAFLTRNGKMRYSVPIGRWSATSDAHEDLLGGDVEKWVERFNRVAREKNAPKAMVGASRMLNEASLAVCRPGSDPRRWQQLLIALGNAEAALLSTPKTTADPLKRLTPLPPLGMGWIRAANDGTPEFRLALALATQEAAFRTRAGEAVASVRGHWMPIDRSRPTKFATGAGGLVHDPDVVCAGRDLERDCVALIVRRMHMAPTLKARGLGLLGGRGTEAAIADVMAFINGSIDDARVIALARPLMAFAHGQGSAAIERPAPTKPDAFYSILRLTHLTEPLQREGGEVCIALDSAPVARLLAGDVAGAAAVCLRRLRASGLLPTVRVLAADRARARRLVASLAFPVRINELARCADLVTKPYVTDIA